jgi:hypothetical protein
VGVQRYATALGLNLDPTNRVLGSYPLTLLQAEATVSFPGNIGSMVDKFYDADSFVNRDSLPTFVLARSP